MFFYVFLWFFYGFLWFLCFFMVFDGILWLFSDVSNVHALHFLDPLWLELLPDFGVSTPWLLWLPRSEAMTEGMRRSQSSGALQRAGQEVVPVPKIPRYLSVNGLTTRRKLAANTGNIHGFLAEDYKQLNWPLPKMFGQEKYGYSLIDIDDPRYLKECAKNSKKLIRLLCVNSCGPKMGSERTCFYEHASNSVV